MPRTNKESGVLTVCDLKLKQRIRRIATLERRNLSQMCRVVMEDALDEMEKARGLPPIDQDPEFRAVS